MNRKILSSFVLILLSLQVVLAQEDNHLFQDFKNKLKLPLGWQVKQLENHGDIFMLEKQDSVAYFHSKAEKQNLKHIAPQKIKYRIYLVLTDKMDKDTFLKAQKQNRLQMAAWQKELSEQQNKNQKLPYLLDFPLGEIEKHHIQILPTYNYNETFDFIVFDNIPQPWETMYAQTQGLDILQEEVDAISKELETHFAHTASQDSFWRTSDMEYWGNLREKFVKL